VTRRQFIRTAFVLGLGSNSIVSRAARLSLHCTPAPSFPVPLTQGLWHSQKFPVGKHDYHVWLNVDRRIPDEELDCDLGPYSHGDPCGTPPLLDVELQIWDGTTQVKSWRAKPVGAAAWSDHSVSCFLGSFEGKRNGCFTLEWNVKKDAGRLKDLRPRVQIVKNPGYWCWL
jgi:hypothetical protein